MCLVKLYFHTQLESVPITYYTWLVVSTPLKNINQLGSLFPIYGKITNVPNHQPDIRYTLISLASPGISVLEAPWSAFRAEAAVVATTWS
jgi:hypothetical protein